MALLKYFKKDSVLPNPHGPLSTRVLPSAIATANKEVKPLLDATKDNASGASRGKYACCVQSSDEEKIKIAKRAAEMGVTNTIRHLKKKFEDRPLKESTVRTWMNKYKKELAERRRCGSEVVINKVPMRRRGHPLLLGEILDNEVKEYIKNLREAGAVINSAIVIAVTEE